MYAYMYMCMYVYCDIFIYIRQGDTHRNHVLELRHKSVGKRFNCLLAMH